MAPVHFPVHAHAGYNARPPPPKYTAKRSLMQAATRGLTPDPTLD